MNGETRWQLLLILPNLHLRNHTPFSTEFLCVCSGDDDRMQHLIDSPGDKTGAQMVRAFRTWFGTPYTPSCLLLRADAPPIYRVGRQELIRSFRNICAVSATTHAAARQFDNGQWLPTFSDFFLFAAYTPGHSGRIVTVDGPVLGTDHRINLFTGQSAGQIGSPQHFNVAHDKGLLRRLIKAWKSYYVLRPRDLGLLPLFRSLEVAFQAGRYPSDGLNSLNDVGTRIGLWVSAFEVLFHPGPGGRVDKKVVQDGLSRFRSYEPTLRRNLYTYEHRGTRHKTNFIGVIYDELYRARNDFMHGNPVNPRSLRLRKSRRYPHLLELAPVAYNIALRAFMRSMFALSMHELVDGMTYGTTPIARALIAARRGGQDDE